MLIDIMRSSEFESSVTVRSSPTAEMRQSSNATQKCAPCNTRSVASESLSDMKENYMIGYTENEVPLLKIFDYLQDKETDEDKLHRLDQIKDWLGDIPETKPEVIPKCTSSTKTICGLISGTTELE